MLQAGCLFRRFLIPESGVVQVLIQERIADFVHTEIQKSRYEKSDQNTEKCLSLKSVVQSIQNGIPFPRRFLYAADSADPPRF